MKKTLLILILFQFNMLAFTQENAEGETWKIDSIRIDKNWRTRDKIILRELQFNTGETVDQHCLDNSISQIWNIGNFAQVDYSLDTLTPGSYLMNLKVKDALTVVPYVTFSGNKDDRNISMGFMDRNFLGRNITLDLQGNIGTYKSDYNAGIKIPRQLLYRNMTLSFQLLSGSATSYRYTGDNIVSAIAYRKQQFSGSIGNPFHDDYKYTFSPNFSWNLFRHKTDRSLAGSDSPWYSDYEINYLALSVGESIGLINSKKHQKDGYLISVGYGVGIGLDRNSPFYQSYGLGASYYKLLNPVVELSAGFSTGYTTATLPSLIHYLGSGHIKGLNSGKESGQGYYTGRIKAGFTWINRDWFAMEHSIYTTFGKANDRYFNIYKSAPLVSIGTGFRFWTPMIPWLSASIHFSYLKGSSNWFHLDF